MKVKWLGHSCFLLTSEQGVRVVLDPFDHSVGYELPAVEADIVTTSHNHYDHNYIQAVQGKFIHINKSGQFSHKGIEILGVATFHDEANGTKRGTNIIYKFNIDGVRVCHCGDLGHVLTDSQIQELGPVDILLVPVGGFYTINAQEAVQVSQMLSPKIIIPMHFKTPVIEYPIDGVEVFLQQAGNGRRLGRQEIEVTTDTLATLAGVIVLEYT